MQWSLPCGKCLQAPDFYAPVPPAPPGLEWWHYRGDVPPLPQPAEFFHSTKYKNWGACQLSSAVSESCLLARGLRGLLAAALQLAERIV